MSLQGLTEFSSTVATGCIFGAAVGNISIAAMESIGGFTVPPRVARKMMRRSIVGGATVGAIGDLQTGNIFYFFFCG